MTDLAITHKGPAVFAFEPNGLAELIQLSEVMARSDMVPKDYRGKPGNIVVAVMAGREIGLSANQSLQSHAVINGRAMLWGDAPLGIVRASGKLAPNYPKERWTGSLKDGTRTAFCTIKRIGDDDEKTETFSVDDAKTAGLWGKDGPWRNYPDRMLKMRARSFLLRDNFGDVLKGVAIAEEYEGHEERNVTPGGSVSGNEALKSRLAASMGAAGITPAPPVEPPVVEGIVEDPLPDFGKMLADQIAETLETEAQARGMDAATYKQVVTDTLKGDREKRRPLNRETAVEVCRAIRAWVAPEPAAPADDEPELF